MSSIKDRQRAAARARLEKEMAERATAARKRRQRQAIIGSTIAVVVIAGGAVWLVNTLKDDPKKKGTTAAAAPPGTVACTWTPVDGGSGAKVKDTGGTPPATVPNVGADTMTLDTTLGTITAAVDKTKAPCTAAAFEYLASKKFWDGSQCHRLTTQGIKVLQCGDPNKTPDGSGSPNFQYAEENLPVGKDPTYPAGTIAMARTQTPGTTGSQFFLVYEDIPAASLEANYTVLGTITKGLDIVKTVAKGGITTVAGAQPGDGPPKTKIGIKTLTMAAAK